MITVESGKLIIPDDERFVGFAGDDPESEIQFALINFFTQNCTFILCLRFDDGTVRTVNLRSRYFGSSVLLVWDVSHEDLYSQGIVTAQIKIIDSRGNVSHTTRDYFFVGSSEDGGESGDYVTSAELSNAIAVCESRLTGYIDGEIGDCVDETKSYSRTYTDTAVAPLARAEDVYTKSEIDAMIGDVETALSVV